MAEMAAEKVKMGEDTFLDVNYVGNMDIEYWNAENDSTDRSSDIKMSLSSRIPNQFPKPIILI